MKKSVKSTAELDSKKIEYVFGYGSIRNDLGNYGVVPKSLKSVGFGHIPFALYKILNPWGVWAGVKETEHGSTYGEVFFIEHKKWGLFDLDSREGAHPWFPFPAYIRKAINVRMVNGRTIKAWVYFANPKRVQFLKKVESGNWASEIDPTKTKLTNAWNLRKKVAVEKRYA